MKNENLTKTFGEMADDAITGLGPSRSTQIVVYLRMINDGQIDDVPAALQAIGKMMSTHEPTRDPAKDKVYDPTNAADWMKMGVDADTAGDFVRIISALRQHEAAKKLTAVGFGQEARRKPGRATRGWSACTP